MAITTVVLDIEGTTSSTWFVHRTLYPYSRARFRTWIETHADRPDVQKQLDAVRTLTGSPDLDLDGIVAALEGWLDLDQKVTPLKAFQGWIWDEGFAAGELTSHFFDDALPCMRDWHRHGLRLVIFSSGSLSAQHAWFGHTPEGSVLPLISAHFDTENAGPKRMEESYRAIAAEVGTEPGSLVFLSDLVAELDAARAAGWHTVGVRREGDQYYEQGVGDHLAITSFDQLDLTGDAPRLRA